MCWNADISLNTFLFSILALLFVFLTQTFTQYKIELFSNSYSPYVYLFFLEVAFMQLIEFFLWRNLKNKSLNENLSYIGSWLTGFQPPILFMMVPDSLIRNILFGSYILFVLVYFGYRYVYNPFRFHTTVAENGHLKWSFLDLHGYENIFLFVFLLFYILPLIFIQNNLFTFFVVFSMALSLFFYFRDGTFGTMWCWMANLGFLLVLTNILLVLPFYQYHGLC